MSSAPPYKFWASADAWKPDFVILGANTDAILMPPPDSAVIISTDGLWGAHKWTIYPQPHCPEFPYLTWIPLHLSNSSSPSEILMHSVEKTMWQANPNHSNIHIVNPAVLNELRVRWESFKAAVKDPFHDIFSNPWAPIQCPMNAYTRAFKALGQMEQDFGAWQDFIKVFQNLQQSLLELQAFLDWWEDIQAGHAFQSPVCAPTWGTIFLKILECMQITCTGLSQPFFLLTGQTLYLILQRRFPCLLAIHAQHSLCCSSLSYTLSIIGTIPHLCVIL
jgi:hypothetical protein